MFMLYGWRDGEAWSAGDGCWSCCCAGSRWLALGVLTSLQGPNFASVRLRENVLGMDRMSAGGIYIGSKT